MTNDTNPPSETPAPEKSALEQLAHYIYGQRGADVFDHGIVKGELSFTVKRDHIVPFLMFLRDDPRVACNQLVDLCGVDDPSAPERFTVVYHLLSMRHNQRVRVKIKTVDGAAVPTVTGVFSGANWFERETYDLYGIYFAGHPDLRRILTDYGFDGHPLRKDFPMTGFVELRYDDLQKRMVYAPVNLVQDYRNFDALSPWDGMTDVQLPGDEKGTKPQRGWAPSDKKVG